MSKFEKGQVLYAPGLNVNCNPIVVKVVFDYYIDQPRSVNQNCVVSESGILVVANSKELKLTPDQVEF